MGNRYDVDYTKAARKFLRKMDPRDRTILLSWIDENLAGCIDPRAHGSSLSGNRSEEWRYRVGNYRILAKIHDNIVKIQVVKVGHRSRVYK
jgi:mRNA interferase RelE/StbE